MKFIDRCRAGEFHNRPKRTEEQRQEYLRSRPIPYYGVMTIRKETNVEKEEREALIAAGILPF